jgi:hypothetical protein
MMGKGSCAQLAAEEAQELSHVEASHVGLGFVLDQPSRVPSSLTFIAGVAAAVVQAFTHPRLTATNPKNLPNIAEKLALYAIQVQAVLQNAIDKLALMSVLLVDPR